MNPFIQNALDDVHTYPTESAILSGELSEPPDSKKWMLKRHPRSGGLIVDDRFRVKLLQRDNLETKSSTEGPEATMQDVFAIGDVAVLEKNQLPATAQVANQEAKWLGKRLNRGDIEEKGFGFNNMGVMTYLGNMKAIMQTDNGTGIKGCVIPALYFYNQLTGSAFRRMAWMIWRGAYLTQTVSWRNKLLIPIYWFVTPPLYYIQANRSGPSTGFLGETYRDFRHPRPLHI